MYKKNLSLKFQSILILLFLGFSWGAGYAIAHYVTLQGVSPITFSFYLAFGPAVLLCLYVWLTGLSLKLSWQYWRYYFYAGVLGVVIPNTCMYIAAPHLPAGLLGMMVNFTPIFIYPLALMAHQEKFRWLRMLSICLGVVGILLITLPAAEFQQNYFSHWALFALLSPLSFAASAVYISKHRPVNSNSVALSAGMLLVSAIILVPLVLFFAHSRLQVSIWHFVNWLVLLQIILVSLGTFLLFYLIKIAGPVYYSLVNAVAVIAGIFWGWLFFAEKLSIMVMLSLLLILVAIVMMTFVRLKIKKVSDISFLEV